MRIGVYTFQGGIEYELKAYNLDRIIIAGLYPHLHEKTFMNLI